MQIHLIFKMYQIKHQIHKKIVLINNNWKENIIINNLILNN